MQDDKRELFGIVLFILIGTIGLAAGTYELITDMHDGWVCYSKHGHILVSVTECKFNLFSGLLLSSAAFAIGVYKALKRF